MFCQNISMVENSKLPQAEKDWLHFVLKVKRVSDKIRREYRKIKIEDWMNKVERVKPDYFGYDGSPLEYKPYPVEKRPIKKKSYLAIYKKGDLQIQKKYIGIEEPDYRDRGFSYLVSVNDLKIAYNQFCNFEIYVTRLINDVEVSLKISEEAMGVITEFDVDLWASQIQGRITNQSYTVTWLNCSLNSAPMEPVETKDLLKCIAAKPRLSTIQRWVNEFVRDMGIEPPDPTTNLIKQGYKTIEEIDAK